MKTFADHILHFLKTLSFPYSLPEDIEVMNPFLDRYTLALCKVFYKNIIAITTTEE